MRGRRGQHKSSTSPSRVPALPRHGLGSQRGRQQVDLQGRLRQKKHLISWGHSSAVRERKKKQESLNSSAILAKIYIEILQDFEAWIYIEMPRHLAALLQGLLHGTGPLRARQLDFDRGVLLGGNTFSLRTIVVHARLRIQQEGLTRKHNRVMEKIGNDEYRNGIWTETLQLVMQNIIIASLI